MQARIAAISLLLMFALPFALGQQVVYKNIIDRPDLRVDVFNFLYGKEGFSAAAERSRLDICTLNPYSEKITIKNTGETQSIYQVKLSGEASKYAIAVPDRLALLPKESAIITIFIKAAEPGERELKIGISTSNGLAKEIVQAINSNICNNNHLVALNYNQSACPCLNMSFDFVVTNTGKTTESYSFGLDRYNEYSKISENPLALKSKESKKIRLDLKLGCGIFGRQIINFYSNSKSTNIVTSVPLLLDIKPCYDYSVATGLILNNNESKYDIDFADYSGLYQMCGGDQKSIQVMIDNYGYIPNTFSYSISGEQWASIAGNSMELGAGEKGYSFIDLSPSEAVSGEYRVTATANSEKGNLGVQESIGINVSDCYGVAIEAKDDIICDCIEQEIPVKIFNTGMRAEDVSLEINGPTFVGSGEAITEIKPGASEEVMLLAKPDCGESGSYKVSLTGSISGKSKTSKEMSLEIKPIEQCRYVKIKSKNQVRFGYEGVTVPIKISHTGLKKGEYGIIIDGPSWVTSESDGFFLEPGKVFSFRLYGQPDKGVAEGEYPVKITIKSDNVEYQKEIKFNLRQEKTMLEKAGEFIYWWRYWIYLGIAALILFIVLFIIIGKQSKRWKVRRIINKQRGKNGGFLWFFLLFVLAIIVIYLVVRFFGLILKLLKLAISFSIQYIWYILLGFAILFLLIWYLNRKK